MPIFHEIFHLLCELSSAAQRLGGASGPGAIEALLHLGAMAVLVTIGYLGIDKLHSFDDAKLKAVPEKHKKSVEKWLAELELHVEVKNEDKKIVLNPAFADRNAYVLLYICEFKFVSRRIPIRSAWYFAYRQCFVPGLNYFRKRHYLIWISLLALASLFLFLGTIIGEIMNFTYQRSMAFDLGSFITYSVSLVVPFASAVTWYLLDSWIPISCGKLEKRVAIKVKFLKDSLGPPGA